MLMAGGFSSQGGGIIKSYTCFSSDDCTFPEIPQVAHTDTIISDDSLKLQFGKHEAY